MTDGGGGLPSPGQRLSVVPEQVRDVGIYIYGLADTLAQALGMAAKDVERLLSENWTGDYATEFADGWTEVNDGGDKIFKALVAMAEKLGVTAESYSATDSRSATALEVPKLNWS